MESQELIQLNLERSGNLVLKTLETMSDKPLIYPTTNRGYHPLWILIHRNRAHTRSNDREDNQLADWKDLCPNNNNKRRKG